MPKIGIVGYFGYNNLGDEWFTWTWKKLFAGQAEVHIVHPLERVDHLDAIIIGGGDLVLPTRINNHYFRDELFTKPYWIYGIGVTDGPWKSPETTRRYRQIFTGAQRVCVRDPISQEQLFSNDVCDDVQVVEDIAWAGPLPASYLKHDFHYSANGARSHGDWLGFSVRPAPMYQREKFNDFLEGIITRLGYRAIAVPLQPSDIPGLSDFDQHRQIVDGASPDSKPFVSIIPPDLDLERRLALISRCSIYVTLRFHGLIAGLRYKVPTVALVRSQTIKFQALASRVSAALTVTDIDSLGTAVDQLADCPPRYDEVVQEIERSAVRQLRQLRGEVLTQLA